MRNRLCGYTIAVQTASAVLCGPPETVYRRECQRLDEIQGAFATHDSATSDLCGALLHNLKLTSFPFWRTSCLRRVKLITPSRIRSECTQPRNECPTQVKQIPAQDVQSFLCHSKVVEPCPGSASRRTRGKGARLTAMGARLRALVTACEAGAKGLKSCKRGSLNGCVENDLTNSFVGYTC